MAKRGVPPVVVVGVDGSPCSDDATQWAASYAEATGGQLHLVTAWSWPKMYGLTMKVDAWDPQRDAQRVADRAAASVALPSDRVDVRVGKGPAADVILAECDRADLLVLGAHAHGASDRLLLGSVSNQCLHSAQIPVVIVKSVVPTPS